jgi:hypothetical protein
VDRSVAALESPLASQPELACVPRWEITEAGHAGCPGDAARCVRPDAGLFSSVGPIPIAGNIRAARNAAAAMSREYTTFQSLRNAQAINSHRPRISGLALSQGMLVLHHAYSLASVEQALEAGGCATEHLSPFFELASWVTDEVGGTDVPHVLESYPPPGREWARRFHRVQLEVLGRRGAIRETGAWREDCEKAAELGERVGTLDADLHVWCGYAYELLEMPDAALEHWESARRSPNHPEASSYANEHLRRPAPQPGIETAAHLPPIAAPEDGGGQ